MRRVAIVVPCFNEERRLDADAFVRFVEAYPPGGLLEAHIVFVDDGSTDGTARVLQAIAARAPGSFRILTQPRNQGKAEAVRKGMLDALSREEFDAVAFWDADLATPLTELPGFVDVLETNQAVDVVLGSRVKLMGHTIERRLWRHYAGRIFATAASMALELPVYDTQCGAKLLRVTDWTPRLFAAPFVARWVFDVELIARVLAEHPGPPAAAGQAIYELPVRVWVDIGGSKVKPTDFAVAALDLARIRLRYPRR